MSIEFSSSGNRKIVFNIIVRHKKGKNKKKCGGKKGATNENGEKFLLYFCENVYFIHICNSNSRKILRARSIYPIADKISYS